MEFVFLIVVGALAYFGIRFATRPRSSLGKQLGLESKLDLTGGNKLVGIVDGIAVTVVEHVRQDTDYVRKWTDIEVEFSGDLPDGLQISRQGPVADLGSIIGLQDIVVGHPPLDELVVIKGANPSEVKTFFARPHIAAATFSIFDRFEDASFAKGRVRVKLSQGQTTSAEKVVNSLIEFVHVLQGMRAYEENDQALIEAGLSAMDFKDNARFVEEEIARRKSTGRLQPSFDNHIPEIIEQPRLPPEADPAPVEQDFSNDGGAW